MKTYYCDFGWRGGVVVVADNVEEALKLVKEQRHNIPSSLDMLIEIRSGEAYFLWRSFKKDVDFLKKADKV